MNFPSHIFKAYDIRGLAGQELTVDLAYKIGRAVGVFLHKDGISGERAVVGRDMRATSPEFAQAATQGLLDEGLNVADIGLVSTPLFNFACAHYPGNMGGLMVTASHNPAAYNGFKVTLRDGTPVGLENGLAEIRDLAQAGDFVPALSGGQVFAQDVLPDYLARVMSVVDVKTLRPLKIVVDAGNGMAKASIPKLLQQLPVQVEYLYLEPDGNFPNHEANPLKLETLKDLQAKVVATGADFGFALDGDADRIGLVDEQGQIVDASFVGALVGLEVLKNNPGALMLYDLRSSRIVKDMWQAAGATTEMCQVGHAHIKRLMKENGAVFASELSLHLYYKTMYDCESSDLSLLYLLQMLSRADKPLSALVQPLKKYFHSGEINFEVKDKVAVIKNLENKYASSAKKVSHLDGLWMEFNWGWFNVRASNTEPVLRLNLEAWEEGAMGEKLAEVKNEIEK
ncbi:MAG: phosphomannomutase/phosphoglucomutase [bacterium]|nr:phosphomannomutase/phosphoglucomutase [bacterium]